MRNNHFLSKLLLITFVLSFICGINLVFSRTSNVEEELREAVREFKRLLVQRQAEGIDVSEAIKLDRASRKAKREGDIKDNRSSSKV
jgi:hypothetical protein